MTGAGDGDTNDAPIEVRDDEPSAAILREESDEEGDVLAALPEASLADGEGSGVRRTKRRRGRGAEDGESGDESDEAFFVTQPTPPSKRLKHSESTVIDGSQPDLDEASEPNDDKKKLAMDTFYDGFSIYGRVLCLVVKRRETAGKGGTAKSGRAGWGGGGQAMMEEWISTQVPGAEVERLGG